MALSKSESLCKVHIVNGIVYVSGGHYNCPVTVTRSNVMFPKVDPYETGRFSACFAPRVISNDGKVEWFICTNKWGKYEYPAGKVEQRDNGEFSATAERETYEETGYRIPIHNKFLTHMDTFIVRIKDMCIVVFCPIYTADFLNYYRPGEIKSEEGLTGIIRMPDQTFRDLVRTNPLSFRAPTDQSWFGILNSLI
jgi:8-oxo-dGTP pyrophosphatase MutT (NUDIX family)